MQYNYSVLSYAYCDQSGEWQTYNGEPVGLELVSGGSVLECYIELVVVCKTNGKKLARTKLNRYRANQDGIHVLVCEHEGTLGVGGGKQFSFEVRLDPADLSLVLVYLEQQRVQLDYIELEKPQFPQTLDLSEMAREIIDSTLVSSNMEHSSTQEAAGDARIPPLSRKTIIALLNDPEFTALTQQVDLIWKNLAGW